MTDTKSFKKPVLSAKEMADYLMNKCFTDTYRRECIFYLSQIHEKKYVDDVRALMNAMRKGNKHG